MITRFKIFEKLNSKEPEHGDYVLVNSIFLKNIIGKIVSKSALRKHFKYTIDFGTIKSDFTRDEIEHFSKNKEDLEAIIRAEKYNL